MKTVSKKKQKQLERNPYGAVAAPKSTSAVSAPFGVLNASKAVPHEVDKEALEKIYLECENMDRCVDAGLHILHNPKVWRSFYVGQNPGLKRAMRALVQVQTIQALLRGRYYLPSVEREGVEGAERLPMVALDKKKLLASALASVQYSSDHIYFMLKLPSPRFETNVSVIHGDCLDAALSLPLDSKKDPLVLDMASMSLPGGGWRKASAAQEENLHRRTNLLHCLEDPYRVNPTRKWDYPIPQYGGVYIPGVIVFRGSESDGYPFLATPRSVSIVASAALKLPPTVTDPHTGEEVLDKKLARDTLRKIEGILSIAVENGHTVLILSAFGCGAYMNPPGHIARLFRQALQSPTYQGRFSQVIFAIIDSESNSKETDASSSQSASSSAPTTSTPETDVHTSAISDKTSLKHSKALIFAKTFEVDLLAPDGSVLHKHQSI
jgi:uncharacterized protein (TIGR02452 family)